jgi:hypothetical protein
MFRKFGILLLWIFSSLAAAQTTPSPAVQVPASPFASAPLRAQPASASRPRPNPFKTFLVVNTSAWAADMATTQTGLLRGATELNPIYGSNPSPARLWGTSAALQGAFLYACHRDSQRHPQGKFWKTMMTVSTALHAAAATNNVVMIRRLSR